jgi:hypothetical protein
MRSTRTTRPLKLLALAVTFAALAVPTAHGDIPPAVKYGPLDPSVYNVVHPSVQSAPFITEHSAGQNGTGQVRSIAASVPARAPNAFDWADAGVGAGVAFAAVLFAVGVATLIVRRGRGRLAGF